MKNEVTHAPASVSRTAQAPRDGAKRTGRRPSANLILPQGDALLRGDAFKTRETTRSARATEVDAKHDTLSDAQALGDDNEATTIDARYSASIRERALTSTSKSKTVVAAGKSKTFVAARAALKPAHLQGDARRITGHTVAAGLTGPALQRFSKAPTITVMAPTRKHGFAKRLFARKAFRRAAMAVVALCVALHPTTRAVAENVVGQWRHPVPSAVLTDPRDPKDFVADLAIVMPRPTIVLTRQDAVAQELLLHVRTLPTRDVLRTAQAISEEAEKLGYDPLLFLALIHIESYYDHLALSPVGAEGLMQLMPPTAEWMAGRLDVRWDDGHSFDPVLNVRLGSEYLAYLHREFGRMDYALTAYNRGPHATRYLVDRFGRLPPEVHEFYAGKVLSYYEKLKAMYGKLPMG